MSQQIVIIDDDEYMISAITGILLREGFSNVAGFTDSSLAEEQINSGMVSCLILDLGLPYESGEDILSRIVSCHPEIPILILTSDDDPETIVRCMRAGASDYLIKPIRPERLISSLNNLMTITRLTRENEFLRSQIADTSSAYSGCELFITKDERMHGIFSYITNAAASPYPFLVTGETGTGKELISRIIHDKSRRSGKFITVNVSGLDDNVLADTLFGHAKGAYTGAAGSRNGLIREAEGGTLFLDEIGDISAQSQVKLLRLLQSGEYYPLGSDKCHKSNARIIAATNRNLPKLIEAGEFRNDLFFRLKTHWVEIPPLRKRKGDIEVLVDSFVRKASEVLGKKAPSYSPELIRLISMYDFPGNVRELEGMINDAVTRCTHGILPLESFRNHIKSVSGENVNLEQRKDCINIIDEHLPTLEEIEKELIKKAMILSNNNQSSAATMLGISRQTLNVKLKTIQI
ncbi:MAG: sigma-54-dependent Fis family transcriptional regulator [Spirochaetes bacterium]|nr:sigma-54-dependent Fis family transcriptional regulator [Spirochaetota bacterium]